MPILLVQPGLIYGPHDHFGIGSQILAAARGKLPLRACSSMGLTMSYVDDVADGFVRAIDLGHTGESYILGGELTRLRDVLDLAARIGGSRPPLAEIPTFALKAMSPLGPYVATRFGMEPNLRELIRVGDRTTYWATDAKARSELGYAPRSLEEGLRCTFEAAGILA